MWPVEMLVAVEAPVSYTHLDVYKRQLFPYGAVFVLLAFVTMLFVKHGDNRPTKAAK